MGTAGAERTHRGDCSTPGAGRDRDHRVAGNPGRTRRSGDWNSAQCGIDVSDPPFQNGGCLQRTPPGQRGGLGANRARRRVSGGGFFQSAEGQSGRNLKSGEQAARLMVLFSFNLAYGNGLERTPVRSSFCVRGPSRFASAFFTAVAACPPAPPPRSSVPPHPTLPSPCGVHPAHRLDGVGMPHMHPLHCGLHGLVIPLRRMRRFPGSSRLNTIPWKPIRTYGSHRRNPCSPCCCHFS